MLYTDRYQTIILYITLWLLLNSNYMYTMSQHPCGDDRSTYTNRSIIGNGVRDIEITCDTGGVSVTPGSIIWYMNDDTTAISSSDDEYSLNGNRLTIIKVDQSNQGVYRCEYNEGMNGDDVFCITLEGYQQLIEPIPNRVNSTFGGSVTHVVCCQNRTFESGDDVELITIVRILEGQNQITACNKDVCDSDSSIADNSMFPNVTFTLTNITDDTDYTIRAEISAFIQTYTLSVSVTDEQSQPMSTTSTLSTNSTISISQTIISINMSSTMTSNSVMTASTQSMTSITINMTTPQPKSSKPSDLTYIIPIAVIGFIVFFIIITILISLFILYLKKSSMSSAYQMNGKNHMATEPSVFSGEEGKTNLTLQLDETQNSKPRPI